MTTTGGEPVFLDTNILVYASVDSSPFYGVARTAITSYESQGIPLWISRQVIREYLATLARPRTGIPITDLTVVVRQFAQRFHVVIARCGNGLDGRVANRRHSRGARRNRYTTSGPGWTRTNL